MTETGPEKTVNVREFRENLSEYLHEAQQGAAFVVTSRGKQVARLGPPPSARKPRAELFGLFKGKIWMADDFDETPADLIDIMENGE